ncbi:GNAT family N-acetyltransferase [Lunatibacter salilacus]|uniref:GNAT family N-acetyltransferase n=1 Tax=Lunatibacter salilacus TaxID=2483804 RepID=UPI00131CA86B|nr:GNAT family N-acetyltransferase [Lunatibacter salilacus]
MIQIHSATVGDIPVIQRIAYHTWPVTFEHILSMEQLTYMLDMMYSSVSLAQQIQQKGHAFLLAGIGEKDPMGFAAFEINYQGLSITKVHKIYILPEAQGKGLGKSLFERISKESIEKGNLRLSLNVNRNNTKAMEFYQNNGFEVVGEEDIQIGQGYLMEDYILEKDLTADTKANPDST